MRDRLAVLAAPERTAIVTQECQGAVMGPDAGLAMLAEEARREALPNIARLLPAARAAGVRVVHCLAQRRPDGLGSNHNAKIFAMGGGNRVDIVARVDGRVHPDAGDKVAILPTPDHIHVFNTESGERLSKPISD